MPNETLQVLFRRDEESWGRFGKRIRETAGPLIIVLGTGDAQLFLQEEQRQKFIEECAAHTPRLRIAARQPLVIAAARAAGIHVIERSKALRHALQHHAQRDEALRVFAPGLWRQMWRSRLQNIGLLTLPRLRIGLLSVLSIGLFLFIVFRLLPSAEIRVWPRGEVATQTMNILLVQSGAVTLPSHIRTLPLTPLDITVRRSVTFDQISKRFTGANAEVLMTIINGTRDPLSLREGTRLKNQAGMIFRLKNSAVVPPKGTLTVRARADDLDVYGEVIGERGNVPAGLQWEIPGLTEEERKGIQAENSTAAKGGATSYRTVLQKNDIETAQKRLERELLAEAKKQVEERMTVQNLLTGGEEYRFFSHDQLVKAAFSGVTLPLHLLNQPVTSIEVSGMLLYRVYTYDASVILSLMRSELEQRVGEGKQLLSETATLQHLDVRVFDFADDLSWIKATVELSGTEQFVLDPLTLPGARFAQEVRSTIAGLPRDEAVRIIKNLPEVEKVEIDLWPPWARLLPSLPSSISVVSQ